MSKKEKPELFAGVPKMLSDLEYHGQTHTALVLGHLYNCYKKLKKNPWTSIKESMPKELDAECTSAVQYPPLATCKECEGFCNLLVVRDQIEQRIIEEASFIDGKFYSLTGHQLHDVTHWQTSKYPNLVI